MPNTKALIYGGLVARRLSCFRDMYKVERSIERNDEERNVVVGKTRNFNLHD